MRNQTQKDDGQIQMQLASNLRQKTSSGIINDQCPSTNDQICEPSGSMVIRT
jgi:hypothetical protein